MHPKSERQILVQGNRLPVGVFGQTIERVFTGNARFLITAEVLVLKIAATPFPAEPIDLAL